MIKRFSANFIASVGVNLVVVACGAATSIILARYLGPGEYGKYVAALAVGALLAVVTNLGLAKLVLREVVDESVQSLMALGGLVLAKLVLVIVGLLLTFLILSIENLSAMLRVPDYLVWASLVLIIAGVVDFCRTSMWSRDKVGLSNILRLGEQAILITCVFALVSLGASIGRILQGLMLASLGVLLVTGVAWLKLLRPPIFGSTTRLLAQQLFVQALPIGVWAFLTALYFRIDTLILAAVRPSAEVGWYSISYTLIQLITSLALIFSNLVMPILSRYKTNQVAFRELYRRSTVTLVIAGFSIAFWVSSIGPELLILVYGSKFIPSGASLRIFSFVVPVLFWVQILTTSLLVLRGQSYLVRISLFNLITTTGLDLALIPILGFLGATIATTVAETVGLALHLYYLRTIPNAAPLPKRLSPVIALGFAVLCVIYLFPGQDIPIAILGTAVLVGYSFLSNFIDRGDRALLRSILQA